MHEMPQDMRERYVRISTNAIFMQEKKIFCLNMFKKGMKNTFIYATRLREKASADFWQRLG